MKKLVLAAAACIMGLSLFLCVQTASAVIVTDTFDGTSGTYSSAWTSEEGAVVEYDFGDTITDNEEFGIYVFGSDILNKDNRLLTLNVDFAWESLSFISDGGYWTAIADRKDEELYLGSTLEWGFYFFDGIDRDSLESYTTTFNVTFDGGLHSLTLDTNNMSVLISGAGPVPTPVPTAALLLGSGLVGLVGFRRRFGK